MGLFSKPSPAPIPVIKKKAFDLTDPQTALSLGFVASLVAIAYVLAKTQLSKRSSGKVRFLYIWLVFDSLCHLSLEASFLFYSTFGRTVNTSTGFFPFLWKEYAHADARWGWADPNVVSLEILTVLGAGPLAGYCAYLLSKGSGSYHYWAVVLCTAELYGGFMTFCPEWLTGMKYLDGSTFLLFWVYLMAANLAWVFIPLYMLYDSHSAITKSLKTTGGLKNQ